VFWKLSTACAVEEEDEEESDSQYDGKSKKVFIKKLQSLNDGDKE
jgi:hypothetical protein